MSFAIFFWRNGILLSDACRFTKQVAYSYGLLDAGTDAWTAAMNRGLINDLILPKIKSYMGVSWFMKAPEFDLNFEFMWRPQFRIGNKITQIRIDAGTDIMAPCSEDEHSLNAIKLGKELVFYDYLNALWRVADCDIVCANDWNGYEVPEFNPSKTKAELFADHHYVRGKSGWQKTIWHLEKRTLVDCSLLKMPPRFLFIHTETQRMLESSEMLPPELEGGMEE